MHVDITVGRNRSNKLICSRAWELSIHPTYTGGILLSFEWLAMFSRSDSLLLMSLPLISLLYVYYSEALYMTCVVPWIPLN